MTAAPILLKVSPSKSPAQSTQANARAPRATARNTSARRAARGLTMPGRRDGSERPPLAVTAAGSGIWRQAEPVARPQDGLDNTWVARIALDLAPEVLHVGVDGPLVAVELVAPHRV